MNRAEVLAELKREAQEVRAELARVRDHLATTDDETFDTRLDWLEDWCFDL